MSKKTPRKCFNCKHASKGFKIAGKTHYYCNDPAHKPLLEDGLYTAEDTLREFWDSCHAHGPKTPKPDTD